MKTTRRSSATTKQSTPAPQFGPWRLPTIERARTLTWGSIGFRKDRPEDVEKAERVAQWIAATGDCVWHALAEVTRAEGRDVPCYCANCDGRNTLRVA